MSKKITDILGSVNKPSKSRKFHNNTKIHDFSAVQAPYYAWPETWKKIYYKAYPRLDQIILPIPSNRKFDLRNILINRESCREFSKRPIRLIDFTDLLYYSVGMRKIIKKDGSTKRTYPSAGARYPLEVYPFIFNVDGIKSSIYHYHLKTHSLEVVLDKSFFSQTMKQFNQSWIRKSALLLVISAIFDRTEGKYKDRGYRHILTEYGHVAQNIYLMSTALGLSCCSIGGFVDDGLNKILDLDGRDESVVGVIAVGNKVK